MIALATKIAALKLLEHDDGHINAADVVTAARDPAHVLHTHFEWSDTVAADKYRLIQAQSLIRAMRLNVMVSEIPLTVPAYVRDMRADTPGYRAVVKVRSEEDIARSTVLDAMQRVSNAARRAKSLAMLLGVEDLVEQIEILVQDIIARSTRTIDDQPEGAA
jgi:hypothetical protein